MITGEFRAFAPSHVMQKRQVPNFEKRVFFTTAEG